MKVLGLLACLVSTWLIQPATQTTVFKSADLRDWLTAAAEHEPGVEDAALLKILGWSGSKLFRTLGTASKQEPTEQLNALLERAALLHADVMLLRPDSTERWTDTTEVGGRSFLVQDGQRLGNRPLEPHIQFARRIFVMMREPKVKTAASAKEQAGLPWHEAHRRNPRINQWYRAVSAELAARHWLADQRPHLLDARRALAENASTLFDSACLSEVIASAQVQRAVEPETAAPKRNTLQLRVESDALVLNESYNLSEAERLYRDTLRIDPAHADARVRLARVLSLKDRPADAQAVMKSPITVSDPVIHYYGALAIGQAAEGTRAAEVAREAYTRAAAMFPKAQSPLLALMRLARERADDVAAKDAARRMTLLSPIESVRLDPWWDYFDCNGRYRANEIQKLYQMFGKKDKR